MENNGDITSSYITTCVLNGFLSYTAVMLNCLTIYALTKVSSLPRPLKTLLLSLAVSDLGVGLMVQPSYIASLVMEMEHKTENNPAYNITYKLYVFTVNLFGFASFFGVTFLSFDRFLAVYLLLRYQELVTHKRVVVVMVSKWVFSAVFSFMRLCIPTRVSFIIYAVIYLSFLLTTTPINYKIYLSVRHHVNQIQALQVQPTANQNGEAGTRNTAGWRKFAIGTLFPTPETMGNLGTSLTCKIFWDRLGGRTKLQNGGRESQLFQKSCSMRRRHSRSEASSGKR